MSKIIGLVKNNKLFAFVVFAYAALVLFMPNKAMQSLQNSLYYVKEMLIIMPVILLLTALISAWVPKKAIEKNLGKNSGIKGSVFSFLLGSFSAGPIYAAFPVCKALLSKGASISSIVIILSTWAVIKVPMLLNESKFLGPKFMVMRWILTALAIFIMGFVTSRFVKRDNLPSSDTTETNTLDISHKYCVGCGLCERIAPGHFVVENKKARISKQAETDNESEKINEAIEKCPSKAISFVRQTKLSQPLNT